MTSTRSSTRPRGWYLRSPWGCRCRQDATPDAVLGGRDGPRCPGSFGIWRPSPMWISGFGVLHQLLRPILTEVEALEASSAAALRSALDLGAGAETTDPVAVCTAALALLVLAARQGPVLLVVDDLQWLDTSTASVLAFIARRLAGHRIGFVGALRLGEAARFDSHGLRSQNVHPLAREDAQQLLLRQFPMLAPRTRQRIVDRAAGYPLALVEWGASLARLPEAESDAAAAALSLPRRLEESFAARIEALPAQTRRALLMLALDGRRDLRELLAVGLSIDDLAPAEAVGALVIDDATGLVDFRHPLMRSALVGSSTSSERRAIHGALRGRPGGPTGPPCMASLQRRSGPRRTCGTTSRAARPTVVRPRRHCRRQHGHNSSCLPEPPRYGRQVAQAC